MYTLIKATQIQVVSATNTSQHHPTRTTQSTPTLSRPSSTIMSSRQLLSDSTWRPYMGPKSISPESHHGPLYPPPVPKAKLSLHIPVTETSSLTASLLCLALLYIPSEDTRPHMGPLNSRLISVPPCRKQEVVTGSRRS